MKFSWSWLTRHLEPSAPLSTIQTRLTDLGLEVEGIENPGDTLKAFKVGYIVSTTKHPNADKLQVCQVDVGDTNPITVVCGGANARANLKVVFAGPGVTLPNNGPTMKITKIRGVESFGMLCSESELGLAKESQGIMELPSDAPIGQSIVDYLKLDDAVIDIGLTPNRGDCLGVRGIARDLAAASLGTLKPLASPTFKESFPCPITVTLDFDENAKNACPHFTGRLIRGVKNRPSPLWLQQMMQAVGLKSISALVDVTNFFSTDLCRPLHVFDATTIKGDITLRVSREGETMKALDDKTYTLTDQMTVVADSEKVLAIGGIMGGLDSGCTLETTDVFLEAAYFDPIRTAQTGRKLGILSDARYRFERGIDPLGTTPGLDLATQMILELCGGEASTVVTAGTPLNNKHTISFPFALMQSLTSVPVPPQDCKNILSALGCMILTETPTHLTVETPSWRHDLQIPQDLVEEILRVSGFDTIPLLPLPPIDIHTFAPLSPVQQRVARVRHLLADRHLMEAVSWSMVDAKTFKMFGGTNDALRVTNPITLELEWMRPSLLPQLLFALKRNLSRGTAQINLFEVGATYHGIHPENQCTVAAAVRCGLVNPDHWAKEERLYDIFDVKNDALAVLESCGISADKIQVSQEDVPTWMHPYRSGRIMQGPKTTLGYFGEVHPSILKTLGIKVPVMVFEVFLSSLNIPKAKPHNKGALTLFPFQPVEKDLAFIVDEAIPAGALLSVAKKAGQPLLATIGVFDAYTGANLEPGKKSLAIRFKLQPQDATLTDADIHGVFDRIIQAVQKEVGGILRDGK
jgi:phenylalanyl-tRNA synthetase beta chain